MTGVVQLGSACLRGHLGSYCAVDVHLLVTLNPLWLRAQALGERVMPAYELIKEEARASKAAAARSSGAAAAPPPELQAPSVPHFLPFTRWAARSKVIQDTFVMDEKSKKKARLSWYHPDDTMVPRDWFRGGLLKDLAYYKPFSSSS